MFLLITQIFWVPKDEPKNYFELCPIHHQLFITPRCIHHRDPLVYLPPGNENTWYINHEAVVLNTGDFYEKIV
jgi:hypothetical protein